MHAVASVTDQDELGLYRQKILKVLVGIRYRGQVHEISMESPLILYGFAMLANALVFGNGLDQGGILVQHPLYSLWNCGGPWRTTWRRTLCSSRRTPMISIWSWAPRCHRRTMLRRRRSWRGRSWSRRWTICHWLRTTIIWPRRLRHIRRRHLELSLSRLFFVLPGPADANRCAQLNSLKKAWA